MLYLANLIAVVGIAAEIAGLPWLTCAAAIVGTMAWSAHVEQQIVEAIDDEADEAILEDRP